MAAIKLKFHCLTWAVLSGLMPAWGQRAPDPSQPPRRIHLLVPGCDAALPLDEGHAFAGPRFLIWDDRITFFEQTAPSEADRNGLSWRETASERLPAAPPAAGLGRARVKWRDGALWMKVGTRVYQRDAATGQWFVRADPGLEFRDFDLDLKGRILLVGTSDPLTHTYRALLEAVNPDHRSTEILARYPDPDFQRWFDRISPVAAASLLTGFESVQIQEFILLFNPLARRVFIYQALDGNLKEAALGLPVRSWRELATTPGEDPVSPGDLCWQVIPKSNTEAWIVYPGAAATDGDSAPAGKLRALALDLLEAKADEPIELKDRQLPLFFDSRGLLTELSAALEKFGAARAQANAPTDPAPAASRHGPPPR